MGSLLKRRALEGIEFEYADAETIRASILNICCTIVTNTPRIAILLASAHLLREIFEEAARSMRCLLIPNSASHNPKRCDSGLL